MADKAEPTIGRLGESQSLEDLDRDHAPAEEGVRTKRSWGGVASALGQNRPALVILAAIALAVGTWAYRKNAVVPVTDTNTAIAITPPAPAEGRTSSDVRVQGLESKVEDAALAEAEKTSGTYVPPLAPLAPPEPPKVDRAPPPPVAPEVSSPANNQANNQQAQRAQKEAEAIEKAITIQLEALSARVDGAGKIESTAVTLDLDGLSKSLTGTGRSAAAAGGSNETRLGYPMGTVWTATLKTGADTDRPGTVQAIIEQGPFAGRTALCNFTWPTREYINLECFAIRLDKESLPIKMVAVGPDEMPNLKAEYNGRYIQRLGSQFLVAFPAAYAEGLGRGGTTVVTNGGTTSTQDKLSGADLAIYAAGKATEPLMKEAQAIAGEIKPQAKIPPMQLIGLMLAEDT